MLTKIRERAVDALLRPEFLCGEANFRTLAEAIACPIFIREGERLPTALSVQSEAFLPGWRVVKNLDRQALTQEVEGANWNFFYLAGEMRATVFGREGLGALRRAVKCVLAKQEGQKFNSLEVTSRSLILWRLRKSFRSGFSAFLL